MKDPISKDSYRDLGVQFSWDFEDVGDRVVKYISVQDNGVEIKDFESLGFGEAGLSVPDARKMAHKYAHSIGSILYDVSDASMPQAYRVALMECAAQNR